MAGCGDVEVVINENVTAEVSSLADSVSAVTNSASTVTIETQVGEVAWKEQVLEFDTPVTSITHNNLKGPIKSTIIIDGVLQVWSKLGITHNPTTGTLDFTGYGAVKHIIWEYK